MIIPKQFFSYNIDSTWKGLKLKDILPHDYHYSNHNKGNTWNSHHLKQNLHWTIWDCIEGSHCRRGFFGSTGLEQSVCCWIGLATQCYFSTTDVISQDPGTLLGTGFCPEAQAESTGPLESIQFGFYQPDTDSQNTSVFLYCFSSTERMIETASWPLGKFYVSHTWVPRSPVTGSTWAYTPGIQESESDRYLEAED